MLLKLDLQRFADGDDDSLDIDSMLEEFEAEWQETEEVEEGPESETEQAEEGQESETETETETEQQDPNDPDAEKRNAAFAQLRREAEANRKYAEFIQRLAEEGGVSPEDLLARYEERKLQAEAQRQQVPVEFLKESRETKSELTQLKEQLRAEKMDNQITSVVSKYSASDDDIRETFKYMMDSGIDPRVQDVDFEKFYRAANLDKILEKEVEAARQKDLEDKRKRQESASIGNGQSVSPSSGNDWSDEEFDAELAKMGIRL